MQVKELISFLIKRLSSKEGRLSLWQGAKYSVVTVLTMPFRVAMMMRSLLKDGCFTIESEYEYLGEKFNIRTFIQPDADIVTVISIPHLNDYKPKDLSVSPEGEALLMREYEAHNIRVVTAFEELDGRRQFWGYTIDLTLLGVNIYPMYDAFFGSPDMESALIAGGTAIASGFIRKFAREKMATVITNLLFKFVGRFTNFLP